MTEASRGEGLRGIPKEIRRHGGEFTAGFRIGWHEQDLSAQPAVMQRLGHRLALATPRFEGGVRGFLKRTAASGLTDFVAPLEETAEAVVRWSAGRLENKARRAQARAQTLAEAIREMEGENQTLPDMQAEAERMRQEAQSLLADREQLEAGLAEAAGRSGEVTRGYEQLAVGGMDQAEAIRREAYQRNSRARETIKRAFRKWKLVGGIAGLVLLPFVGVEYIRERRAARPAKGHDQEANELKKKITQERQIFRAVEAEQQELLRGRLAAIAVNNRASLGLELLIRQRQATLSRVQAERVETAIQQLRLGIKAQERRRLAKRFHGVRDFIEDLETI